MTSDRTAAGDDPIRVVEQWQERAWGNCDLSAVDEFVTDPLLRHGPSGSATRTHAELKNDLRQYQRALGKPEITVHARVLDDDRVWSRLTMRGANMDTGEPRTLQWLQIHRVVDGKIVEIWALYGSDVSW